MSCCEVSEVSEVSVDLGSRIYVAGHRGMVGSAITRRLVGEGFTDVVTRTHDELPSTIMARSRNFSPRSA